MNEMSVVKINSSFLILSIAASLTLTACGSGDGGNSVAYLRDNLYDVVYVTNRRIGGFTGDGNNAHLTTARSDLGVTDTNSVFDVYLYDFPLSDLP